MRRYIDIFILAIIAVLTVSCKWSEEIPSTVSEDYLPVDPLFREYYDLLGGIDVLGPAISEKFVYEGLDCQFTANALLVHDPQSTDRRRFYLAPIGLHMNLIEPPVPQPDRQGIKYVEGHVIYEKFLPLYEQMGGGLVAGKPLTELHFNPSKHRYEQYFENIGFYIMEKDSSEAVKLLSYGAWHCPHDCRKVPPGNSTVYLPYHTSPEFTDTVSRLSPTFTGFAISEDYLTPDGYTEQVFENVVLISDPNQPGGVILRSVPERLGYLPESPVHPSDVPGMVFYPTKPDGKGFHIPTIFLDYMAMHGGQELFGQPIDQRRLIKDNVYRQCFQKVCLEEHPDEYDYLRVRPSPLGYPYKEMAVLPVYPSASSLNLTSGGAEGQPTVAAQESVTSYMPASQPPEGVVQSTSYHQLTIRVWESYPLVSPDGYQEINVSVYGNNAPLSGVEPDLSITMPDRTLSSYDMAPTGEDGQSRQVLEPIKAQSGTLVPYEVCVSLPAGQKLCVKDSFLIWQTP